MKLKCCLVRRKLTGYRSEDRLPDWIIRHIDECPACCKEAAQYQKLQDLMQNCSAEPEISKLTWDQLREKLAAPAAPRPVRRLQPGFALTGALAVMVIAAGLIVMDHPRLTEKAPKSRQTASIVHTDSKPPRIKSENRKESASAITTTKTSDWTAIHKQNRDRISSTGLIRRPVVKHSEPEPVKMASGTRSIRRWHPVNKRSYGAAYKPYWADTNSTTVENQRTLTENLSTPNEDRRMEAPVPTATLISAEEHVIDIIGTRSQAADEAFYVIDQIGSDDEDPGVRL